MERETISSIAGRSFFCSWSGGKDSCLALYHAMQQGGKPQCLINMLTEDGHSSRSHGLPRELLAEQAEQLGLPIVFNCATWGEYETKFQETLRQCRAQGIESGVFGDIDVESHLQWCVRMGTDAGMGVFHPLWQRSRRELLSEFLELGFKAMIVVTQADKLGPEWLGRTIDRAAMEELAAAGVDICGELGEYHTLVTGGPLFKADLRFSRKETVLHEGYWFLRLAA